MHLFSKGYYLIPFFICAAAGQAKNKLVSDRERALGPPEDFTLRVTFGDETITSGGAKKRPDGRRKNIPLSAMKKTPTLKLRPYYPGSDDLDYSPESIPGGETLPDPSGKFFVVMLRKEPAEVDFTWAVQYLNTEYKATIDSQENYTTPINTLDLVSKTKKPPVKYEQPSHPVTYKIFVYRQPDSVKHLYMNKDDFNQYEFEADNGLDRPTAKSVTFDTYEVKT